MNLSKSNKKVAVIERQESVGGGCVHWGTIPSKALRHSVSRYIEYKANPLFNISERPNRLTFPDIFTMLVMSFRNNLIYAVAFTTVIVFICTKAMLSLLINTQ